MWLEREGVEYMDGDETKDCSYREFVGIGMKNLSFREARQI